MLGLFYLKMKGGGVGWQKFLAAPLPPEFNFRSAPFPQNLVFQGVFNSFKSCT